MFFLFCFVSDPGDDEKTTVDGVMRFLDDLQLNPESRTVLIVAWKFKAKTQCEFTKEEFITGMMELGLVFLKFEVFITAVMELGGVILKIWDFYHCSDEAGVDIHKIGDFYHCNMVLTL